MDWTTRRAALSLSCALILSAPAHAADRNTERLMPNADFARAVSLGRHERDLDAAPWA